MEDVDSNYKALKKNIKDFSKTQNIDKKKRWALSDCLLYQYSLWSWVGKILIKWLLFQDDIEGPFLLN